MRTAIEIAKDIVANDAELGRIQMANNAFLSEDRRAELHAELMEARRKKFLLTEEERHFIFRDADETEKSAIGEAAGKSGE